MLFIKELNSELNKNSLRDSVCKCFIADYYY